jgi:L-alanine-DL-glutamate epimerase-like enolase superfamily enzyme
VRVWAIEAIPLNIGFPQTFRFGTVDRRVSSNVLIRIDTDEGITGWGEACPVPAFSGETQESVVALVERRIRDGIVGLDPLAPPQIVRRLEPLLFGCPFTLAAVDMALWDVMGKAVDLPVSTLLGGRYRETLPVHGSVGIDAPEAMVEVALTQREQGYRATKLYAGRDPLDVDLRRVAAVRAALGPAVEFILDVNGLWDAGTCLRALPALDRLGVRLLEQPLPAWDEPGLAEVTRTAAIDVVADEAVVNAYDVARVGRNRTARVINLGVSRLGGLTRARECAVVAAASSLRVLVGSVLELGVATAAGMHLAASLPSLVFPSYLIGPIKYERDVTAAPLVVRDGQVPVPTGPGLGIEVDTEVVAALDRRGRD